MMETQRAIDIIFNMMPEDEEEAEALSLAVSALRAVSYTHLWQRYVPNWPICVWS